MIGRSSLLAKRREGQISLLAIMRENSLYMAGDHIASSTIIIRSTNTPIQAQWFPLSSSELTVTLGSAFSLLNSITPASELSPQSEVQATLIQPLSPHSLPHWFLISQLPVASSYPTSRTAWLSRIQEYVGQLLSTPPPQSMKLLLAYMPTITGPNSFSKAFSCRVVMFLQVLPVPLPTMILLASLQIPGIWGQPVASLYEPAVQGQEDLSTLPTAPRKVKVSGKYPPLQSFCR